MSKDAWGDDGNPAEHGRDTVIYQELRAVSTKYLRWFCDNMGDLPNNEMIAKAKQVETLLDQMLQELNQPL